jgi:hypothetical protein
LGLLDLLLLLVLVLVVGVDFFDDGFGDPWPAVSFPDDPPGFPNPDDP